MKLARLCLILLAINAHADERLFEGLGNLHRKVTTNSAQAQRYFDQGLAFLFAFNHDEAIRSFTEATKLDPKCTMCWWGLANANGPHINNPVVDEPHQKAAWEAIQKGLAKGNRSNRLERALMRATAKRFSQTPTTDRSALDNAYAQEMRLIWKKNAKDPDVGVLFAEAMMDLRPWDFYKPDGTPQEGTPEILDTLRATLKRAPKHPQAIHLLIHAVEASNNPGEAVEPADRLRDLQPSLGHMVHMPSHIDVRVGNWKKAIESNARAMKADAAYREIRKTHGFYRVYMAHNPHMLAFAAMMSGQRQTAVNSIDSMVAAIPAEWAKDWAPVADGYMAMPLEARIRFGMWDEVLAQPEFPEYFPLARALRRAARSIAYSALGKVEEAKGEQAAFLAEKVKVPSDSIFGINKSSDILAVAEHLMNGELLVRQRKIETAIAELREAIKAEDALRYSEPPDWIMPARHTLGALLLSAGREKDAVEVYEADLKKLPNNVWSLKGLSEAYAKIGETEKATKLKDQFDSVRRENNSDTTIESSCLCIAPK